MTTIVDELLDRVSGGVEVVVPREAKVPAQQRVATATSRLASCNELAKLYNQTGGLVQAEGWAGEAGCGEIFPKVRVGKPVVWDPKQGGYVAGQ